MRASRIGGDKHAGRRNMPIIIGNENTVKLSILITLGIAILSWIFYFEVLPSIEYGPINPDHPNTTGLVLSLAILVTSLLTIFHLINMLKHLDDRNFVRDSVTKKSMPLHLLANLTELQRN
jgi:geranylgeranylglycerol-phosphate geranylgeranyltransferase